MLPANFIFVADNDIINVFHYHNLSFIKTWKCLKHIFHSRVLVIFSKFTHSVVVYPLSNLCFIIVSNLKCCVNFGITKLIFSQNCLWCTSLCYSRWHMTFLYLVQCLWILAYHYLCKHVVTYSLMFKNYGFF